jgi:helix-turn-helix, Psq domain
MDTTTKREVLDAVRSGAATMKEASVTYGIPYSTLYYWLNPQRRVDNRQKKKSLQIKLASQEAIDNAFPNRVVAKPEPMVLIDKNLNVIRTEPNGRKGTDTWIVEFEGLAEVEANSIDDALIQIRKLNVVRHVISARMKKE